MLAATLAEGHTVIRPAAREPEVDDLIAFLQKMGAEVERTAPDTIEVEGRRRLRGAEHRVIPDRIEAGTFVVAAAVDRRAGHPRGRPLRPPRRLRRDASGGWASRSPAAATRSRSRASRRARAPTARCDVETAPYPGFATDLQPPTCVLLTQARRHEPRPRDDLRGPPGVARRAAQDGRGGRDPRPAPRRDQRARPPPRRGGRDRRPAGRRLAHPGGPGGRRDDHDPRRAPRPPRL